MTTQTTTNTTLFKVKNIKLNSYVKDQSTLTKTGATFDDFEAAKAALLDFTANTRIPLAEMRIVRCRVEEDLTIKVTR